MVLKIILISGLIIAAIFLNKFYSDETKERKSKEILGKETIKKIEESAKKNIEPVVKSTQQTVGSVLGSVTNLVSETASKAGETAGSFVFEQTVGNIVKQIDKLPPREREKIKEEVCR
jgi:hypothetical protein